MNKIFLISLLCFSLILQGARVSAQIILEHTIDSTGFPYFYVTDIGTNEDKYVFLNKQSNSFSLYNLDMSPYLIDINIPSTDSISQGFGVIYITKTLFDCDTNNIEYVYENPYDVYHKFRIFRTDGTLLLEVDSANGPWGIGGLLGGSIFTKPIINTSQGTKLFLQKFDINSIPQILIYNLCGTLSATIFEFRENHSYVRLFPNPSSTSLNIEISPPNNLEEFQFIIIDTNSIERHSGLAKRNFSIDINSFESGTYYYSYFTKDHIYQTGKFVILK